MVAPVVPGLILAASIWDKKCFQLTSVEPLSAHLSNGAPHPSEGRKREVGTHSDYLRGKKTPLRQEVCVIGCSLLIV